MYSVTMVCLANSKKPPSGRCIAGKKFSKGVAGEWIRPVSARATHEVSEDERRYEGGKKAQLLDIVSVPLLKASPLGHQTENYVLDDGYYWTKVGVATWNDIKAATDSADPTFWAASQSTFHGMNDKVAAAHLAKYRSSLKLVMVDAVELRVRTESGFEGGSARRRVRAKINISNDSYLLSVTDPEIEEQYLIKGDGDYDLGQAALCVSLAEVWNGFAFRVAASVITAERCKSAS
jgi:putative nucleic acid modification protein with dual OB domain